ncbi:MAG: putative manganese-dependent inorganic diphosphatase [Erysipelotrichaceae bacterium]
MEREIYVTGHKNPDTDSICSAIAYASLKQQLGIPAVACRLGELNTETDFVLKKFDMAQPIFVDNAKCKLKDIEKDEAVLVDPGMTIKQAWDKIIQIKNKSLFVVDKEKHLLGVVSMSNLSNVLMTDFKDIREFIIHTPLTNIQKTLNADLLVKPKAYATSGYVQILVSADLDTCEDVFEGSIVVLGNHHDIQRKALLQGASCLILVGEKQIDNDIIKLAKEKNCAILHTPEDAIKVARLIYQTPSIQCVMQDEVMCFHEREFVDEVSEKMAKSRFRSYPVLDDNKHVIGAISRFHLFNYEKKKFILLDHNERSQSVEGFEYGEVLEIVDHHRIGDIETLNPINFRNQSLGSTCTIVALLYKENNLKPSKKVAGLLCCAIISDTMNFNSPTTTPVDRMIADELAKISEIDTDALAQEMFEAVATLRFKSFGEILYNDFKEYSIEGNRIGIGQINLLDIRELEIIKKEFITYIEKINNANKYDLLLMVFTNAEGKGSNLVFVGKKSWAIEEGFKDLIHDRMYFVDGIVSRKKQIIPRISSVLKSF